MLIVHNNYSLDDAFKARQNARLKKETFVLTNGCFDLFHAGHAYTLNKASELGDLLWVGINSDMSVKALKGKGRPVNSQLDRGYLLNSIKAVDGVFFFEETNLAQEIMLLEPDIYVKSMDYTYDSINKDEREALEAVGAKISFVPLRDELSSSSIIKKIKDINF